MEQRGTEPNGADEDWDNPNSSADQQLHNHHHPYPQYPQGQFPPQFNDNMQINPPPDCDMDTNSLIQQFNCLGTTDKEVLVSQLQKFIGPNLNKHAAQFFLDMNDWNLQRAIGSYFDLTDDQALWGENGGATLRNYSMALVDSPAGNEVTVSPNIKFSIGWKVMNNGAETWPPGTHLKLGGHHNTLAFTEKVFLQSQFGVPAGEIRDAVLELTSPPTPGSYAANYQLTTPEGFCVGGIINLIINVVPDETVDLSNQFQNLQWNNGGNEGGTPNIEMS